MKVSKKGTLKLEKKDTRFGNFVVSEENGYFKMQDIGGVVSFRVRGDIAIGRMIGIMLDSSKKGDDNSKVFLENYITMFWNLHCSIVDYEFMTEVLESSTKCINRHKDVYGIKDDITANEDAQILDEVKEMTEVEEMAKKEEGYDA